MVDTSCAIVKLEYYEIGGSFRALTVPTRGLLLMHTPARSTLAHRGPRKR